MLGVLGWCSLLLSCVAVMSLALLYTGMDYLLLVVPSLTSTAGLSLGYLVLLLSPPRRWPAAVGLGLGLGVLAVALYGTMGFH